MGERHNCARVVVFSCLMGRRGRIGETAVTLMLAGPLILAAGPAANVDHKCRSSGRTLARTPQVRVSARPSSANDYAVYACLRRTGQTVHLGDMVGDPGAYGDALYAVKAARVYVVYDSLECQRGECIGGLHVRNMESGVVRHERELTDRDQEVTDDVVTPRGSAAWIRKRIVNATPFYVVRTMDSRGRQHRVGFAPDIDPSSLTYNRQTHRASWLQGGNQRGVSLP
jgi:hypothetical protein